MPQTEYIRWVPAPNNIKRIGKIHTLLYVGTFGLVGGRIDGLDILLLTTIGKKTGRARAVPLPFFRVGSAVIVVGSFGGNAKDPAWVANVAERPEVRVQRGFRRWNARARLAQGEEREHLWTGLTQEFPRYAVYQTKTPRPIPLVVIDPPPP
jgi:deazaflavin-dependent oxidoreductase (nitroreductase family)